MLRNVYAYSVSMTVLYIIGLISLCGLSAILADVIHNPKTGDLCYRMGAFDILRGSSTAFRKNYRNIPCCPNYENLDCRPICKETCINSLCITPAHCLCYNHSFIHMTTNICSHKTCDNCKNGYCNEPNVCTCRPNYEKRHDVCHPKCSQQCRNGECVDVDVCACHPGYEKDPTDPWNCVPYCENTTNCKCTGPNICECIEGFKEDKYGFCTPHCDNCENGRCIRPGYCECSAGYQRENNTCIAVCDKVCANGTCIGPNTCSCDEGYEVNADNVFQCVPICKNPSCAYLSECVAPEVCECVSGFVKAPLFNRHNLFVCTAICNPTCINGFCSRFSNNVCYCSDDFQFKANSTHECEPVCKEKCDEMSSYCSIRHKCECKEGYQESQGQCIPVCDGCENGECIAPGLCECYEGYNQVNNKCTPKCRLECINGECVGPDKCKCSEGYYNADSTGFICRPKCNYNCASYGICIAPNRCICKAGYSTFGNDSNPCLPVCHPECKSSVCAAPNECLCHMGYEKDEDDATNCYPQCKPPCDHKNMHCAGPNRCECQPGYYKDNLTSECEPKCTLACFNATCVAPNTCECIENFSPINDTHCSQNCKSDCVNGECVYGECVCPEKFVLKPETMSCEPVCTPPCKGGFCALNNTCVCEMGHKRVGPFECTPSCSAKTCINGYCDKGTRTCKCHTGYKAVLHEKDVFTCSKSSELKAETSSGGRGILIFVLSVVVLIGLAFGVIYGKAPCRAYFQQRFTSLQEDPVGPIILN